MPVGAPRVQRVGLEEIRRWQASQGDLRAYTRSIGRQELDASYLENAIGLPLHLRFLVQQLVAEQGALAANALAAIPFYSLCKGLLLPLSGVQPEKAAQLFGIQTDPAPDAAGKEELVRTFLAKPVGLDLPQRLCCLLGDPFRGRPSTLRRDSLLRLLQSVQLIGRRELLDRLARVGEVAALFAQSRAELRRDPPLTALEVLETLRLLPAQGRLLKFALLRSLLARCGKLEAYFLARLVLRSAGLGADYQGGVIARALADRFDTPAEHISHALALSDAFEVARLLQEEGADGLRRIRLQPLVPVRPALASAAGPDTIRQFPVWVERKYDGIRLLLHKSTDAGGSALCGAYTRNRGDWLELIRGLDATIKLLPARSLILDGELHGVRLGSDGLRPASMYDVYRALHGEGVAAVQLKVAAFDLLYLDGADLTGLPLSQRQQHLRALLGPLLSLPLPVPIGLAEGQLAQGPEDIKRLYGHFRSQGYEGVIAKRLDGAYRLATRDPTWVKRKPQITLDLVLLGALLAVTTKQKAGLFGSYVIGAAREEGTFEEVGDVAGLDQLRDAEIQQEIMREGLLTGRRLERRGVSGTRPGFELRPHIVVTVKFSELKRDPLTKQFSLRDPKVLAIRADKSPFEADKLLTLDQLHLRQQVG